ncbi:ABC transporter substrate-binding protein (plasmid) [Deinococcus sp. D7000]|nr:ABC transporter substrate-binding protein [Deinococcus sp. D7000]
MNIPTACLSLLTFSCLSAALAQSTPATPPALKAKGEIVFCTEVGYPPFEFFPVNSRTPQGFDIDLATELARRLGVKVSFENTGFDGIVAALMGRKCDAVISAMSQTPERQAQVDFVLYLQNNRALMVRKGNPAKITSFDDLCGKTVGAQVGSANYDDLVKSAEGCRAGGKPEMKVKSFKDAAALKLALITNQIDAYNTAAADAAVAQRETPDRLEIGAVSDAVNMIGMALRKNDAPLRVALTREVKAMHKDGAMDRLLKKWALTPFRLKNP